MSPFAIGSTVLPSTIWWGNGPESNKNTNITKRRRTKDSSRQEQRSIAQEPGDTGAGPSQAGIGAWFRFWLWVQHNK